VIDPDACFSKIFKIPSARQSAGCKKDRICGDDSSATGPLKRWHKFVMYKSRINLAGSKSSSDQRESAEKIKKEGIRKEPSFLLKAYFFKTPYRSTLRAMKKFGIIVLIAGVLVMGITAYKFIEQRKRGSEEQVQDQSTPFPWLPTVGALLTAGGIIMMGSDRFRRVR